jgi:uncharacterized protein YndB with AHSA1/START domain
MERKTTVDGIEGTQNIQITREFDLTVEQLYKAYTVPEIIEQWMGTKVIKFEGFNHGGWKFETSTPDGIIVFSANGVHHEVVPNQRIVRTFEIENSGFPAQLEFIEFEALTESSSKLSMLMVFKTAEDRNNILKLPFAYGLNMAHDKLQSFFNSIS